MVPTAATGRGERPLWGTPLQKLPLFFIEATLLEPPPGLLMRFGWAEEPRGRSYSNRRLVEIRPGSQGGRRRSHGQAVSFAHGAHASPRTAGDGAAPTAAPCPAC